MDKLHGLPNIKREAELNNRIYKRNIPSNDVQMYYQMRSVDTRFQLFPSYDVRKPIEEPLQREKHFEMKRDFLPGDGGPFEGYIKNINDDSILKNITFPAQAGHQSKYVPPSDSDLYNVKVGGGSNEFPNKHSLLFETQKFTNYDLNPHKIGTNTFFNHTRQQLKDT